MMKKHLIAAGQEQAVACELNKISNIILELITTYKDKLAYSSKHKGVGHCPDQIELRHMINASETILNKINK